jgi:hypothetical protein
MEASRALPTRRQLPRIVRVPSEPVAKVVRWREVSTHELCVRILITRERCRYERIIRLFGQVHPWYTSIHGTSSIRRRLFLVH